MRPRLTKHRLILTAPISASGWQAHCNCGWSQSFLNTKREALQIYREHKISSLPICGRCGKAKKFEKMSKGVPNRCKLCAKEEREQWVKDYPDLPAKASRKNCGPVQAVPFKFNGVYCRLIPLTQGLWTIVDETDYEWLTQWNWHTYLDTQTGRYYACSTYKSPDGRKKTLNMHRFILGLTDRNLRGDHIDALDTLNNSRKNLRIATVAENGRNGVKRSSNTSGFKGVYWHPGADKWRARITFNYKGIHICLSDDKIEAARAYDRKAIELYGEFARTNFPRSDYEMSAQSKP